MNSDQHLENGATSARSGGVRLQDVARHLGVHPMTVSRALSGSGRISQSTRESVRRAAEELGYKPNLAARSLRQGRNLQLVPLFANYLDSGINTQKLEIIQNLLGAAGYETPIHSCGFHNQTGPLQAEMLVGLRAQRPAAIICTTHLLTPQALEELKLWLDDNGVLVTFDHDVPLQCDQVIFDREDAGYRAAGHLLDLGHKRIAYAHHSPVHGVDERLAGHQRALRERGLELPPTWILRADQPTEPTAGGRDLAAQFLQLAPQERPTAICVVNDLAAMAFIAHLQRAGVDVPRDISLVAHDDRPVTEYAAVPLTVVTHPAGEVAHHVVRMLQSRLKDGNDSPPERALVQGKIISRSSCAAPA